MFECILQSVYCLAYIPTYDTWADGGCEEAENAVKISTGRGNSEGGLKLEISRILASLLSIYVC